MRGLMTFPRSFQNCAIAFGKKTFVFRAQVEDSWVKFNIGETTHLSVTKAKSLWKKFKAMEGVGEQLNALTGA